MNRRDIFKIVAAAAVSASTFGFGVSTSMAQEVTLRMHQFLPAQANVPAHILIPWAEKIGKESGGRIKSRSIPRWNLAASHPN